MVVAVVAVRVMEVPVDQIVGMIAMRDGRMSAVRAMHVLRVVTAALMIRRTRVRILGRHGNHMLLDLTAFLMM